MSLYEAIESGYQRRFVQGSAELSLSAKPLVTAREIAVYRRPQGGWAYRAYKSDSEQWVEADGEYQQIVHCMPAGETEADESMTRFLIRTAFECRFCYEGIVSLHAACVEMGDFAVAFTGPSGRGKSTRARAWVEGLGARWISGDRPAVRLEKHGSTACGVPWDGKEQFFRDIEVPLMCIMEVRRSSANYVRKLSEDQAYQVLMQQSFVPMWDTDAALMAMANVRKLVRQTPVYRVFCGNGPEDAKVIHDILVNHPEQIKEEAEEIKIKKDFVLRNVVDEHIIMPTGNQIATFEGAVVLNEVAAFIYEQMKNPLSRKDLLEAVLNEYDVDESTAKRDIDELLERLLEYGIIQA